MRELIYPFSEQLTLVIENHEEIVYFSYVVKVTSHEEVMRQLKLREKHKKLDPISFDFAHPYILRSVSFTQPYPMDIIVVDNFENVFCTWSEPANHSGIRSYRNFTGLKTIVMCPKGFIRKSGVIPGISKLSLRSGNAYLPIYYSVVWGKELKTKTDEEIIAIFNGMTGTGYRGLGSMSRRYAMEQEIFSRWFDSSILFTLDRYKCIESTLWTRRVKLVDNRLEFESPLAVDPQPLAIGNP